MYVLNMTYIFVWSLGRTYFIIFFKQSNATEPVRGESVCPKMGIDCIPNGTLKKYPAYMPHISFWNAINSHFWTHGLTSHWFRQIAVVSGTHFWQSFA